MNPYLDEPLASLVLKLERAKKHIRELESEHERFLRDNAYRIDFKTDPSRMLKKPGIL
jgi:hypothetical protein